MSVRERHRREREARAEAILAAAARVFARHGLEGATIAMVAREAEVAVGTIYLYFASRDDLYLTLVAERGESLRARYLEIQARGLGPLDELHAIAAAYLDYLCESRELFISQQSISYAQLEKRLRRRTELSHFRRVIAQGHEVFALYGKTIRRVVEAGLIAHPMGVTRTAAIIWATLNGAFMLMGNDGFFRDVTGLNTEHFIEEALESHLVNANPNRVERAAGRKSGPVALSRTGSAGNMNVNETHTKGRVSDETGAIASA
ncbi:MAG TPA: TetR/AcrR family transcriptional regulator [Candidatus Binataceae bacterium]|nr:TetR/AcrR family transcriptional regulator [Candidatus Binataceae bacterium]